MEIKIEKLFWASFYGYISQCFPGLNTLRSLILCNDRELMQHLSSYIEVLIVKVYQNPAYIYKLK